MERKPMPTLPTHTWVADAAGLGHLEHALAGAHEVALDTESNSMFAYRERLCLVQLAVPSGNGEGAGDRLFLVDPLAFATPGAALAPLTVWMTTPGHRVVLHGGEYDVAILKRDTGVGPLDVFDTQAAATMLGLEHTGYASMVTALLDVPLAKSHQQFDWARRPLPSAALGYALADVVHLLPLARLVAGFVAEADLEEEVALACAAVTEAAPHAPARTLEATFRKLARDIRAPRQRPLAFALVRWREREAETLDVPPGMMLANDALVALAERPPTTIADATDRLPKRLRDAAPRLLAVIAEAEAHPPALPAPEPRVAPPPADVRARESRLKQWRQAEAERRAVPLAVVLPARALDHLAHHGLAGLDAAPQLGPKRLARYRDVLTPLLR